MSAATVSPGVAGVESGVRVRPRSPRPSATIVSIEEARRRLRADAALELESAIARHPASRARRNESTRTHRVAAAKTPNQAARFDLSVVVKVVVGLVFVVVLFASALGAGLLLRPTQFSGDTWMHSVAQGESVWGLAESLGLSRSLESVVEDIYALNSLTGATLQPGQQLVLPAE